MLPLRDDQLDEASVVVGVVVFVVVVPGVVVFAVGAGDAVAGFVGVVGQVGDAYVVEGEAYEDGAAVAAAEVLDADLVVIEGELAVDAAVAGGFEGLGVVEGVADDEAVVWAADEVTGLVDAAEDGDEVCACLELDAVAADVLDFEADAEVAVLVDVGFDVYEAGAAVVFPPGFAAVGGGGGCGEYGRRGGDRGGQEELQGMFH